MHKKDNGKYIITLHHGRVWLGKRRDSGVWYIRCPLPNSPKPLFQSTGTTIKKDALREADHLSAQVLNAKYHIADDSIEIRRLIEKFYTAKSGHLKVKSLKRLMTTQSCFMAWLSTNHPKICLVKHLSREVCRGYQSFRVKSGLSMRTVDNDIKNMHTFFCWGMKEHLVSASPFDYSGKTGTIDLYNQTEKEPDVYTGNEYHDLVVMASEWATEPTDKGVVGSNLKKKQREYTFGLIRDLIIVYAGTGMRFEEGANLRIKNLYWNADIPELEVRAQNGWSPKDKNEVKRIPMLPEVKDVILRRARGRSNPDDLVFTNTLAKQIHEGWTLKKLKVLFPYVGIAPERDLYWHSFRNYFVIRMLKAGVAINAIMKWTGHDSASMVLHYAKAIQAEDVRAEFQKAIAHEKTAVTLREAV